jgi:hypothetical protein
MYVGRDYPMGIDYVRIQWKKALRNPDNCPSCYASPVVRPALCERELRKAVGKGRQYIREMIAVIQFKKYRAMKKRYDDRDDEIQRRMNDEIVEKVEKE